VIAVAGPQARAVLQRLAPDWSLDRESFPFMSVREGVMAGVPVRVLRVSFTGELSYEIHVACDCAAHLWQAVMHAGEPFGIIAYGTQAMHVLRAEKGFICWHPEHEGARLAHQRHRDGAGARVVSRAVVCENPITSRPLP